MGVAGHRRRPLRRRAERARALARRRRVRNVIWKRGEFEKLPIRDAAVDVALLSQALHHAHDPAAPWPKRRGSSSRADACWCSTCASTTRNGSARSSAIAARLPDDELRRMLRAAG